MLNPRSREKNPRKLKRAAHSKFSKSRRTNYSCFSLLTGSHHIDAKMWCNSVLVYIPEPNLCTLNKKGRPCAKMHHRYPLWCQPIKREKCEYFPFLDKLEMSRLTRYTHCAHHFWPKKHINILGGGCIKDYIKENRLAQHAKGLTYLFSNFIPNLSTCLDVHKPAYGIKRKIHEGLMWQQGKASGLSIGPAGAGNVLSKYRKEQQKQRFGFNGGYLKAGRPQFTFPSSVSIHLVKPNQ